MERTTDIPFCPIPPETISDMVPMLVVLGLFLLGGWLLRRRKKRRGSGK
ncbi:MAG: LPXTG cell wall anchor domain-containing protein [Kiritimatiellales bacterium]|nr:LPXTG cell wall anchor domain-containing protein [Kiritimatiellales bacterium]MCF7864269.1 LPXTG cell wall anchor domain-containing protein [Kiritimatiellales bacterium]